MRIVKANFSIIDEFHGMDVIRKIERCGRVCYKSEGVTTDEVALEFVHRIIQSGHESVLEHFSFSVLFTVDRAISLEIIRHRPISLYSPAISQESTRYCNYGKDAEISFIDPLFWDPYSPSYCEWKMACRTSEEAYLELIKRKATPQEARSVLNNSLKTELVFTTNIREWRHFLKLRTSKAAHPQMREVTIPLLNELKTRIPVVFDDINV